MLRRNALSARPRCSGAARGGPRPRGAQCKLEDRPHPSRIRLAKACAPLETLPRDSTPPGPDSFAPAQGWR